METFTFRELQRDRAQDLAACMVAGLPVAVDGRAFVVPAKMVAGLVTDEEPLSCSKITSRFMQARMSKDEPIPIRFGQSKEVKAWMVPLSWRERLGL